MEIGVFKLKKSAIYLGICCLSTLLSACTSNDVIEKDSIKIISTPATITQEQKDLLYNIGMAENEITNENLSKRQKDILNQYNYAMEFLAVKYPSYTFNIINCEINNLFNPTYSIFYFQEINDTETYYDLYLYVDGDNYLAEDNFYGYVIGDTYENALKELLIQENIPCEKVESRLDTVQGLYFGENLDISKITNGTVRVQQSTDIYINGTSLTERQYTEIADTIQTIIEGHKIYGSFYIMILDYDNGGLEVSTREFNVFY